MAKSKKVNKWDAAPESIGKLKHDLRFLLDRLEVRTYDIDDPEYKELVDEIFKGLDKTLDDFNELEARHQKDIGLISQYEEENKKLQTDYCDIIEMDLNQRYHKRFNDLKSKLEAKDKECTELRESNELCMKAHLRLIDESTELTTENAELRSQCEFKDDALQKMIKEVAELEKEKIDLEVQLAQSDELRYRAAKYAWTIKTVLKKASFSPGHVAEELRFVARKSTTPKDVQERWEGYADELLGEHSKLIDKINQLEEKNEELKVENNNLTTDNKRLNDAVEAWFNMFNDMRHKRDDLKKGYEKLKETNISLRRTVNILDEGGYF